MLNSRQASQRFAVGVATGLHSNEKTAIFDDTWQGTAPTALSAQSDAIKWTAQMNLDLTLSP